MKSEKVLASALFSCSLLLFTLTGCKAFYENSGSDIQVGEITTPLNLKEPTTSCNLQLLFNMTGAKVWTAKDSIVKTTYRNAYTNAYLFGMVDKTGVQDFDVTVEPLDCGATNAVEVAK